MTATQFEAFIKPSFDARQQLEVLDDQRTNLLTARANADEASLAKAAAIVAGVLADPACTAARPAADHHQLAALRHHHRSAGS